MTRQPKLIAAAEAQPAPQWSVERWFNTTADLELDAFRGRVVALHAFQILCPGCVVHGVPQAQRIAASFDPDEVAVVGLHSVFEHHAAMGPASLEAFLHEYAVSFPVAVDRPSPQRPVPETMQRYHMRGTPSLVLIDREGRVRLHTFGRPEDMLVGAAVALLVGESAQPTRAAVSGETHHFVEGSACSNGVCLVER